MNEELQALQDKVVDMLRTCYDPEIPVNIYDLGLVYQIEVEGKDVRILMTLTSPNCPVAESLLEDVLEKVKGIEGIDNVEVNLTFDPVWSKDNLSEEAKLELGLL